MPLSGVDGLKKQLRSTYKNIRLSLGADEKELLDSAVAENLFALDIYRGAEVILAFVSKDIEVGTQRIIERALSDGKRVAAPLCDTETTDIDFYFINSRGNLKKGFYGLYEPDPKKCAAVTDFSGALCLVPALAYDREGYRLGFGKGYYDRFLARFNGVSAGLCYECCVSDELPRGRFDRRVDALVTDKAYYSFGL